MDQPVFADVQVARARTASPIVRPAVGQIVLKLVQARPALFAETLQRLINRRLRLAQGFELSGAVVNDAERTAEAQFDRAPRHGQRVLRIFDPAADYRIDADVK